MTDPDAQSQGKDVPQVQVVPPQVEPNLADLLKLAEPLLAQWAEVEKEKQRGEDEKHRRQIEYDLKELDTEAVYDQKALDAENGQSRLVIRGVLAVLGLVIVIAGGLFYAGRDTVAMHLIELFVGLGGAGFGGYGIAQSMRRKSESD